MLMHSEGETSPTHFKTEVFIKATASLVLRITSDFLSFCLGSCPKHNYRNYNKILLSHKGKGLDAELAFM